MLLSVQMIETSDNTVIFFLIDRADRASIGFGRSSLALPRKTGLDTADQPAAAEHIERAQAQVVPLIIGEGHETCPVRVNLAAQGQKVDRPIKGPK
ncbi:MAG: hypothetical protein H6Q62_350 [Firmicutes bacterium]|nr:hypothetical protein [Bacillota bacterium]